MGNSKGLDIGLIDFDPNFGPEYPMNIEAARVRGLEYDKREKAYFDEDGVLIRDEFGQPL